VLGVIAKPALDAWKQEQAILAALTLPRNEGEPLDEFALVARHEDDFADPRGFQVRKARFQDGLPADVDQAFRPVLGQGPEPLS